MGDDTIKKYIDSETALSRVRGNTALYVKMLGLFLKSNAFKDLEDFLEDNELEKASEVAHAIKGMSGNLGMDLLFDNSTKLMLELRQGTANSETIESYRESVTGTRTAAEQLIETLS